MSIFNKQKNAEPVNEPVTEAEKTTETLGMRISENRKRLGLTQEEFAEKLGVTAQAVSKWENDISCPDIMLLPQIAGIFGISIDELMGVEKQGTQSQQQTEPVITDADLNKLKLRITIFNANKSREKPVKVTVPVAFVMRAADLGIKISAVMGNEALNGVPMEKIVELIKTGVTGEILDLTSDDGTRINIEIS